MFLGELGSCRSAAAMEEAISFPSAGSEVHRRQTAPVLGPDNVPGTGRRQSRERAQTPVPGWKKGPPLSSRHSLMACKDHGDTGKSEVTQETRRTQLRKSQSSSKMCMLQERENYCSSPLSASQRAGERKTQKSCISTFLFT